MSDNNNDVGVGDAAKVVEKRLSGLLKKICGMEEVDLCIWNAATEKLLKDADTVSKAMDAINKFLKEMNLDSDIVDIRRTVVLLYTLR